MLHNLDLISSLSPLTPTDVNLHGPDYRSRIFLLSTSSRLHGATVLVPLHYPLRPTGSLKKPFSCTPLPPAFTYIFRYCSYINAPYQGHSRPLRDSLYSLLLHIPPL